MTTAGQTPGEQAQLEALFALALREQNAGHLAEAAVAYRKVLALRPDIAGVRNNLGNVLMAQGMLDEAVEQFARVIALEPNYAEAHYNLGCLFRLQGKLDEAAARFEQSLALKPDLAEAHNNLGKIFWEQNRLDLALKQFEQAVAVRPNYAEAHNNLGNILWEHGQLDRAITQLGHAIALRPNIADPHNNLGNVLLSQGKLDEAAARYEQALALRPDYPEARLGLATCYLAQGDYERGWSAWEERLRMPGFVPPQNVPRWTGQPLAGRSLLLLAEQGLGDTLHFVRYARLLKERGARIVLAAQAALGRLLTRDPDFDELFILGSARELPRCDFYLPLLSAPGAFGTDASNIPGTVPYLAADPELTDHWRQELAGIAGVKIGIVWQGSRDFRLDCWRSIPLADFAPLARLPGVRLISLQNGFGSEQIAAVDFPVVDLSDRLDKASGPFMDTAAVIGNLDLVVAPDTAIAHLAGALGAPVSLALQLSPNWRWLQGRDDSPWYPTMRLFRQTTFGVWSDVFERIAHAVQAHRSETP